MGKSVLGQIAVDVGTPTYVYDAQAMRDQYAVLTSPIHGAGAYGFAMSSNYNSRPRAAEVLIDGDRWTVTREREGLDDLVRGERPLDDISSDEWRTCIGNTSPGTSAHHA